MQGWWASFSNIWLRKNHVTSWQPLLDNMQECCSLRCNGKEKRRLAQRVVAEWVGRTGAGKSAQSRDSEILETPASMTDPAAFNGILKDNWMGRTELKNGKTWKCIHQQQKQGYPQVLHMLLKYTNHQSNEEVEALPSSARKLTIWRKSGIC